MAAGIAQTILALLHQYGLLAFFVAMALETGMILHYVPSEVMVPYAAVTYAHSTWGLALVILVATAGATVGSLIPYAAARYGGRDFLLRHPRFFHLTEERMDWLEEVFRGPWGETLVFVGRLLPFLRALVSIPAGLASMDLKRFVLFSAAGSAIFNAVLAYTAYQTQIPGSPISEAWQGARAHVLAELAGWRAYLVLRWPVVLVLAILVILAAVWILRNRRRLVHELDQIVVVAWERAAIAVVGLGLLFLLASLLVPTLAFGAVAWIAGDLAATIHALGGSPAGGLAGLGLLLLLVGLVALAVRRWVRSGVPRAARWIDERVQARAGEPPDGEHDEGREGGNEVSEEGGPGRDEVRSGP